MVVSTILVDRRRLVVASFLGWIRLLCKRYLILGWGGLSRLLWCLLAACCPSSVDHVHPWMGDDSLGVGCAHTAVLKQLLYCIFILRFYIVLHYFIVIVYANVTCRCIRGYLILPVVFVDLLLWMVDVVAVLCRASRLVDL